MSTSEARPGPSVVEVMITVVGLIVLIGLAVPAQRGLGVRANVTQCVEAANAAGPSTDALLQRLAALPHCADVRPAGDGSFVVTVRDGRARVRPVVRLAPSTNAGQEAPWRCSQVDGDPRHMPVACRAAASGPSSQGPGPRAFPATRYQTGL